MTFTSEGYSSFRFKMATSGGVVFWFGFRLVLFVDAKLFFTTWVPIRRYHGWILNCSKSGRLDSFRRISSAYHFRVPGSDRFSSEHSALIREVSTSPFSSSHPLTLWLQVGFHVNPPQVTQRIFLLAAGSSSIPCKTFGVPLCFQTFSSQRLLCRPVSFLITQSISSVIYSLSNDNDG